MKVRKAEKNTNNGARRDCMGRSVGRGAGSKMSKGASTGRESRP
jgi:hypothetical protein